MRWGLRLTILVLVPVAAAACGGDGDGTGSTTQPAPTVTTVAATTTTAALPTNDQLLAALLTPTEVGPGFSGPAPIVDQRTEDVAARPLCDIKTTDDKPLQRVSVGPIVTNGSKEQVFERITIERNPDELLSVIRRRAEARCEFVETASNGISYTVKVDGPVDVTGVGDAAAGLSQTYSKGYEGKRWDMTARKGRLLVNVQYTSTSAIDPTRAKALLAAAVAKAAPLA